MANRTEVNYYLRAKDDARDTGRNFFGEIIEQLLENGEASNDLYNDYANGDAYHHENHVDKSYDLLEAANVLDQLSEHEETDYGLWNRADPRQAIIIQAAYTYRNAVMYKWEQLIKEINDDGDIEDILALEIQPEDDGNGDGPEIPAVDKDGKGVDEVLAAMLFEEPGIAADYAEETGCKYAAQIRAGYLHEAQTDAKELLLRQRVKDVIDNF